MVIKAQFFPNEEVEDLRGDFEALADILECDVPPVFLGRKFNMQMGPGVYHLESCIRKERFPKAESLDMASDEIFVIRDEPSMKIREEIRRFKRMRERFESMNMLHKRGLAIFGPPGSGKTSLLRGEMKKLAEDGNMVFTSRSPYIISQSLKVVREMEPDRDIYVVMEDIDETIKSWGEQEILEMFDGVNTVNHVMFICTTNNLEMMSEKMKRPGRLDVKIEVPNPAYRQRLEYLKQKTRGTIMEKHAFTMADKTEGMGFGHLRELIVETCGYGVPLQEAIRNMQKEIIEEKNGRKRQRGASLLKSYSEEY